jgi:ferrochelatase
VDKLRAFFNHPAFIAAQSERVQEALDSIPAQRREEAPLLYTAHSIPLTMARTCDYEKQLQETSRLITQRLGRERYQLAYQSRSGPPSQPWLAPDICDALKDVAQQQSPQEVVVAPIGFLSDHLEVLYDLDVEASQLCEQLGVRMVRAGTVGTHPRFVQMIVDLVQERLSGQPERLAIGDYGPQPDVCPDSCCPRPKQRPPREEA